jgi:hypothetical protein
VWCRREWARAAAADRAGDLRRIVRRGLDEIANHGFHVAADVTHFGVLRGFHFYEWAACESRQASRNFRLPHAGRTDHQNILGQNIFGKLGRKFLAAHAIAQSDGHGLLREVLADDVFIQLDHDFARGKLVE